jgi:DNA-binding GntR family transcriptional regulator
MLLVMPFSRRGFEMPARPLSPAQNLDLRQIVYEKIKEAIIEGVIPPGERLSEVDLAEQLMVSRTPVREAIRQLAQTGLITLVPRKGAYVTLPTIKDVRDLYELRITLEVLSLEHVCANPPREQLEEFRNLFQSVRDTDDPNEYLRGDKAFHSMIREATGNRFLGSVLNNVMDLIHLCRHYSIEGVPLSRSSQEHVKLISAILDGETDLAKDKLRTHLLGALEALVTFLKKHPEFINQEG